MRTLETSAARTQGDAHAEPVKLLKRIGSTTVEVTVHFSETNNETMADIVRRLIPRDIGSGGLDEKIDAANILLFAPSEREVKKCA